MIYLTIYYLKENDVNIYFKGSFLFRKISFKGSSLLIREAIIKDQLKFFGLVHKRVVGSQKSKWMTTSERVN